MASEKALQSVGLLTTPNRNALPPGALLVADNTVIEQAGTVQPRPGYDIIAATVDPSDLYVRRTIAWNSGPSTGGAIIDLLPDADKMILTLNPSGSSTDVVGMQSAVNDTHPYEAMIARGNLYSTGALGMQKLFLSQGPGVLAAGMPRGLPFVASIAASSSASRNWFHDGQVVGYRTCLVRTDTFGYAVRGAPSGQVRISNRSGVDARPTLTIPLPDLLSLLGVVLLIPGDTVEVYRSAQVDYTTTEPPDDMNLVQTHILTATDISTGSITVVDSVSDVQRQTQPVLYTSPSAEGIGQANETPPGCSDCSFGNRLAFYGDIVTRPFASLSLFGNDGYAWDGNVRIGKHATQVTLVTTVGLTAAVVTAGSVLVGQCVSDAASPTADGTKLFGDTIIVSNNGATFGTGESLVQMSKAAKASGNVTCTVYDVVHVGGRDYFASDTSNIATREFNNTSTPASLDDVVNAFCLIVNLDPLGQVWAHPNQLGLTSNGITYPDDGSPGVVFYGRTMAAFNVTPYLDRKVTTTVNVTAPTVILDLVYYGPQDFKPVSSPVLTPTVYPDRLIAAALPGGVYVSKQDEPEAVPVENLLQVGDTNARVIRMVSVREAVWVFKTDGLFRIAGGDITSLSIDLIDPSVRLLNSYAADAQGDHVFAWTTQGVTKIGDGGAQNVSQAAIGADLSAVEQLLSPDEDQTRNAFIVCDSNQSRVLVGVPTVALVMGVPTPSLPTQIYCFSTRTMAWTKWILPDNGPYAACLDGVVTGRIILSGALTTYTSTLGPPPVPTFTTKRAHYFERERASSVYTVDFHESATVISSAFPPGGTGYVTTIEPPLTVKSATGDVLVNADGSVATVLSASTLLGLADVVITDIHVDIATLAYYHAFQSNVQWAPFDMNEYDIEKTWCEIRLLLDATKNMVTYKMIYSGTPNGSSPVTVSVPITKTTVPTNVVKRIGIPRNVSREQLLLMELTIKQGLALWELDGVSAIAVPSAERVGR